MTFRHRVRLIFLKELADMLRDRRTLVTMIVVPILLYPLLMLGSVQAISAQSAQMVDERFRIGVEDEDTRARLESMIATDLEMLRRPAQDADDSVDDAASAPLDLERVDIFAVRDLEEAVRERVIEVGFRIRERRDVGRIEEQWVVEPVFDPEEFRSYHAADRLVETIKRTGQRLRRRNLSVLNVPQAAATPFIILESRVTSPGSVLGQILPLVLVLMTITGAIYPAIDLTAGERERGTLETLMVCPVPVIDLVVGKFLAVTTIAILGAALNLGSVSATVYLGGFKQMIGGPGETGFPFATLPVILLALVPFAILFAAIMMAVCSYARSFKEAQNYVTPVIIAALIPGGMAALPASKLAGVMLVMPVGNMVLLTRDLLLGSAVPVGVFVWVILSTSLYAATAIAVATHVFGQEAVVFSDTGALKTVFSRRLIRPAARPSSALALVVIALMFPLWYYVQTGLQSGAAGDLAQLLRRTGMIMPLLFVGVPVGVALYWKIDLVRTFALRGPPVGMLAAGVLVGAVAWVPAHEIFLWQQAVLPAPQALLDSEGQLGDAFARLTPGAVLLLVAVIPALCEELLFRGFLLSALRGSMRKWPAVAVTAVIFATYHYYFFKFATTMLVGLLLGYLCWQSRSIWPAVLAHLVHNARSAGAVLWPQIDEALSLPADEPFAHLPAPVLLGGVILLVIAVTLCRTTDESGSLRVEPQRSW